MKSPHAPRATSPARQRGVVLIISLVMLVVISLLATFSIRNSVSSEAVSGNVRTSQLAAQAAEIALRYCEDAVKNFVKVPSVALPSNGAQAMMIMPYQMPQRFHSVSTYWDVAHSAVFVLSPTVINGTATFKRMPECMVENMPVVNAAGALNTTSTYIITARGFGPEVAFDATRGRPNGSEVWLQSTIELE